MPAIHQASPAPEDILVPNRSICALKCSQSWTSDIVVAGGASSIFSASASDFQKSNVHHAGYVSDDDLAALVPGIPFQHRRIRYPLARSHGEGLPGLSSNAASLVEAGGDVVIYVDPGDGDGWRDAIVGLSQNDALRQMMAAQGRKGAAAFSWSRSAQLYLEEILRLTHGSSR
jgi:glycosyltransferase involved in cell wall biosynthesis